MSAAGPGGGAREYLRRAGARDARTRSRPGACDRCLPGAEVHAGPAPGRLLVVVEDVGETRAFDTIAAINRLPGVIAASLVYHHFEPLDVDDRGAGRRHRALNGPGECPDV
ncbi:MAG: chaperone NapD [Burkholderiaceae bacterium]